jgi:hypothetical protein
VCVHVCVCARGGGGSNEARQGPAASGPARQARCGKSAGACSPAARQPGSPAAGAAHPRRWPPSGRRRPPRRPPPRAACACRASCSP